MSHTPTMDLMGEAVGSLPNLPGAACKGHPDADRIFFGDGAKGQRGRAGRAAAFCRAECPVVNQCAEWVLAFEKQHNTTEHGVWGGMTERARKKLRGIKP